MKNAEIRFNEIDFLFFTHPDHAQITYVLQNTYWNFPKGVHTPHRPTIFVLPEQVEWVEGYTKHTLGTQGMTLHDFANIIVVENNKAEIEGYTIEFIDTTGLHCVGMQSAGLVITHNESSKNLIYTSDIKNLKDSGFVEKCNTNTVAIYQDTHGTGDPVHAGVQDVLAYYPEEHHNSIFMMHLGGKYTNVSKMHFTEKGKWVEFK